MKLQDVILKALAKKLSWVEAAEIAGVTERTMSRWREVARETLRVDPGARSPYPILLASALWSRCEQRDASDPDLSLPVHVSCCDCVKCLTLRSADGQTDQAAV